MKRTESLHIRLTPEEKILLQQVADKLNVTITSLIINLVRKESEK